MSQPKATVIVPAHNEEAQVGRCLASLRADPMIDQIHVVVVSNGSTDRTVKTARSFVGAFPNLTVLELATASKVGALNAGDELGEAHPRIYLDADIELSPGTLREMVEALDVETARMVAPTPHFESSQSSWSVRAFYRIFSELPYVSSGPTAGGVYGVSAAGRNRFGKFPDLMADDLFVQRHFSAQEWQTVAGSSIVRVPRTVTDLVKVRARATQGSAQFARNADPSQVDASLNTRATLRALGVLVCRKPSLLLPSMIYVAVTLAARAKARTVTESATWLRDESSRVPPKT